MLATHYGTTKLAAEWMIREYARAYGLSYTIFRYFNASGADPDGRHGESRHHEGHIIPLTLLVAVGNCAFQAFRQGLDRRAVAEVLEPLPSRRPHTFLLLFDVGHDVKKARCAGCAILAKR